jgi:hypothetical protein
MGKATNPYDRIHRLTWSWGDTTTFKAYSEDNEYLLDIDDSGLAQLALRDPPVEIEVEGASQHQNALLLRPGTVLLLDGFEVYRADRVVEIRPGPAVEELQQRVTKLEDQVTKLQANESKQEKRILDLEVDLRTAEKQRDKLETRIKKLESLTHLK